MKYLAVFVMPFLLLLSSCTFLADVDHPEADPSGLLNETTPLINLQKTFMEGVYSVVEGKETFGEEVILKWNRNTLSILSNVNAGYIVLKGGILDSVILFAGTWRQRLNTETGRVDIHIPINEGGKSVIALDSTLGDIVLRGVYGSGNELPQHSLVLKYIRPFSPFVMAGNFLVLAHRGGGRNSDYLGVSENTVEMISHAESFGAMGIEVDVRLSKDNIPFIYHDDEINLRTAKNSVIWGKIEHFNYYQIKGLITLKNGEKIPTLREVLEYVLEKTDLQFVWLDMKCERNDISIVSALQKEILQRAQLLNRKLQIMLGIPTEDKEKHLMSADNYQQLPSLCELSTDEVRKINAQYWAPRWTEGLQNDKVNEIHGLGKKAIVWTLDEEPFIKKYINEGNFDGVLTNYPSLAAYYHYIR